MAIVKYYKGQGISYQIIIGNEKLYEEYNCEFLFGYNYAIATPIKILGVGMALLILNTIGAKPIVLSPEASRKFSRKNRDETARMIFAQWKQHPTTITRCATEMKR